MPQQFHHTRKELLFLMFKEINLRNHSSLHKLFYSLKEFVKSIYLEIQSLLVRKKIDYFSPSSRNEEIKKDNFASWIHKETILNDKYQSSINTAEVITARWIVNIIYEKMILLDFSVLEKYFMNYVLSYIHHPDYYEGKNERMFKS